MKKILIAVIIGTLALFAMFTMSAQAASFGRSSASIGRSFSMPKPSYSAPKPVVSQPKSSTVPVNSVQKPVAPPVVNTVQTPPKQPTQPTKTVTVNRTTVVQQNVVQQAAPASGGGMFGGLVGNLISGGLGYWLGSSTSKQEAQNKCLQAAQSEEQRQSCMQIR